MVVVVVLFFLLLLLLLFYCPMVHEVCPNNEVTKPETGTSPDPVSVAYFYVYNLLPSLPTLFDA